jgi:hypothetical protein
VTGGTSPAARVTVCAGMIEEVHFLNTLLPVKFFAVGIDIFEH